MLYYMITIKFKTGKMQDYLDYSQTNIPPLFEKHGVKLISSWLTTVGEANEMVAIHGYRDFESLQAFWQSEDMQEMGKVTWEYMDGATTKILTPTPYSPIQ